MSKLNLLIRNLCPDGVEYAEISDLCKTLTPKIKIKSNEYLEDGLYPVIDQGQKFIGGYTNEEQVFPDGQYIIFGDHTCVVKYVDFSFAQGADGVKVLIALDPMIPKFLFYCMANIKMDVSYARHWSKMKKQKIPVPPIKVQREIVRILDHFTELTEELTEELTTELTTRKQQYEYYRDQLLTFDNDVRIEELGNVCNLQAGKSISAADIYEEKGDDHDVPCYGANGLRGYVNRSNESGDKSIIGRQGALCGNVSFATGMYYATEHAVVVSDDEDNFNSRYLYHLLVHADLNQYKTAGAQPGLSVSRLNRVRIAVPKREVQDRIADVLDHFDAICSDLSVGLPAEINARQKQYEYYRDQLLTFKEKQI